MPAAEASSPFKVGKATSETKIFTCNECEYQTKNGNHIKGHMTGHVHLCNMCTTKFKTVGLLRRHMREVHNTHLGPEQKQKYQDKIYKCSKCRFEATTNDILMKHEKDRHTPRKYTTCVFFAKGICNRGDACYFPIILPPSANIKMNVHSGQDVSLSTRKMNLRNTVFIKTIAGNLIANSTISTMKKFVFLGLPSLNSQTEFPPLPGQNSPMWRPW